MIVRRDRAALRGGAGLLLVMACMVGPAAAHAAPGDNSSMDGGTTCEEANPSASASDVTFGADVHISGTCFEPRGQAKVVIVHMETQAQQSVTETVGTDGTVSATLTPKVPGGYAIAINVGQQQGTGSFKVTGESVPDPEDPEDPEVPEDPPTEEPTDPVDPPTESEEPTTPVEPTDPETPTEAPVDHTEPPQTPESPDDTVDPTTAPGGDDSSPSATPSDSAPPSTSASPDPAPSTPTKPFPSATDDPAPTADAGPTASEQTPTPSAPAAPAPATNDFPAAAPEYTAEQREAASLAVLMTSLFAHGVSNGQVGTSPAEAGTPNADGTVGDGAGDGSSNGSDSHGSGDGAGGGEASDGGGEELAETGAELTGPATLAALALTGGAGLLWYHRRHG